MRPAALAALPLLLGLLMPRLADAKWPGRDGRVCFDTPRPQRYSGQDHKEAVDGRSPDDRQVRLQKLEARPLKYTGALQVRIDKGPWIPLPKRKGVLLHGLDPARKHRVTISNTAGKRWQSFWLRFPDKTDPRVRIRQASWYHIHPQVMPPPRKCPFADNLVEVRTSTAAR